MKIVNILTLQIFSSSYFLNDILNLLSFFFNFSKNMKSRRRKRKMTGCGSGAVELTNFHQSAFIFISIQFFISSRHSSFTCFIVVDTLMPRNKSHWMYDTFLLLVNRFFSVMKCVKGYLRHTRDVNWFIDILLTFNCHFRDWKFEHPEHGHSNVSSPIPPMIKENRSMTYSMRLARVGGNSLFSKEVLYSLVITNVLSIIIGAGIG